VSRICQVDSMACVKKKEMNTGGSGPCEQWGGRPGHKGGSAGGQVRKTRKKQRGDGKNAGRIGRQKKGKKKKGG